MSIPGLTTEIIPDFTFPEHVKGWLTYTEGHELARLAAGKRVLEIGSYCGRSTICLAQTAASVTCIDPHDGRATSDVRDTWGEFHDNIRAAGMEGKVRAHRGTTLEVLPGLDEQYDLVFIDGDHSYRAVLLDYAHATSKLAPDGLIAFHDYHHVDPGVMAAVHTVLSDGARMLNIAGSVAVVKPYQTGVRPVVPFLAIPSATGWISGEAHTAAYQARQRFRTASFNLRSISATTGNFNTLYATALNARDKGVTHFAMLHDDVGAEAPQGFGCWLDVLTEYMRAFKLGAISAAVRIKDESGETSTALDTGPGQNPRRLKLAEIGPMLLSDHCEMPLLINTGCMVIDLLQPWSEEVLFRFEDKIIKGPDGKFSTWFGPEDWELSRWMHKRGIRYGVTTDVRTKHVGRKVYE